MSRPAPIPYPFRLQCIACQASSLDAPPHFRCPGCGDLLEVVYPRLRVEGAAPPPGLNPARLKQIWSERRSSAAAIDQSGVWRFRELLPTLEAAVTLSEGNTPVYELPRCARGAGLDRLLAKHQGMNPTGSFKDTGMTVAISLARAKGFRWVGCASTGNTSASMAAYAARAGIRSLVLVPARQLAWGKLAQALDYGALTCELDTDFDGCVEVMTEVVRRFPVYLVNSMNPFRLEGQKTAAMELMEQLGWRVPDHVIVPGGNLANASALGKGFLELRQLGVVARLPKISIIQAAGANPLVRALREKGGAELVPVRAETRATAIRIGNPASWKKAVAVLQVTGGACEEVGEEEIALAKAEIGAEGVGCEPASATTLAGLKKLVREGFVRRRDLVVLVLTGHVLKDPDYTIDFHDRFAAEPAATRRLQNPPVRLEASADAVIRRLEGAQD